MKDGPGEWKETTVSKKGSKGKQQEEAGTSQKSNSPTSNTRKATECAKEIGGSETVRKPRQNNPIPKLSK